MRFILVGSRCNSILMMRLMRQIMKLKWLEISLEGRGSVQN